MPEWSDHLRRRLASLALSPEREAEIIEELSHHLDDRYEELRAGGATDADARRAALGEGLCRGRLLSSLVFGVSPHDWTSLVGATLTTGIVGVASTTVRGAARLSSRPRCRRGTRVIVRCGQT